jgi:CBS domain containing-hemolysin-like protein
MQKPPKSGDDYPNNALNQPKYKSSNTKISLFNFLVSKFKYFKIFKKPFEFLGYFKATKKKKLTEKTIFSNFQEFNDKIVEDVVIPRSDIIAVRDDVNLEDLNQMIIKFSHTRILVYNDTLDNIIGFIHIKDLFKILARAENFNLKKLIRKPIISAPSMKLSDLLREMQRRRTHIAIVVDEYGGTDGMVTIEDIMEEIFGRIDDEHDEILESDSYKVINHTTILSNSRVEVEDLEKILGVQLKDHDDEFDTIGGLVLAKVGSVPLPGTKINISDEVELEVIDANPRTLKLVKLKLKNGQLMIN